MSDYYESMASEHRLAALQALRAENDQLKDAIAAWNTRADLAQPSKVPEDARAWMTAPTPPQPSPQQGAPIDERKAFEAWGLSDDGPYLESDLKRTEMRGYFHTEVQSDWRVWQARAALQQPKGAEWTDEEIMKLARQYEQDNDGRVMYRTHFLSFARAILAGKESK